jgi:hypothetical protein
MTPTTAFLLALTIPAAPAPKGDAGVPTELIDLLPADTAGVLIVDAVAAGKSEIGQTLLKLFAEQQRPDQPIAFAELGREAEWVLLSQFLIDQGVGDFCLIARLKEGSEFGKATVAQAKRTGIDPQQIGTRTVRALARPDMGMTLVDDRTLMVVLATDPTQVKQTWAAAFTPRDTPGPSRELRKLITDGAKDRQAIQMYGHHPKKVSHSAYLALASFGVQRKAVTGLGDKLTSYRGGIRMGEMGDVELRFAVKDADAAKAFLKTYEIVEDRLAPFIKEFRAGAKLVQDGDDVVLTARLTKATAELVLPKRNK